MVDGDWADGVSTGKLKRFLVSNGVDVADCLERDDLVKKAKATPDLPLQQLVSPEASKKSKYFSTPAPAGAPGGDEGDKENAAAKRPAGEAKVKKAKRPKKVDEHEIPDAVEGSVHDLGRDWRFLCPGLIFKTYGVGGDEPPATKVAAFDLDGTLIRVKSGRPFSVSPDDWCPFNAKVFKTLEKFHKDGYRIVVFSNQAGVGKKVLGKASLNLRTKVDNVAYKRNPKDPLGGGELRFPFVFFCANRKDEVYRKPADGMFTYFRDTVNAGAALDLGASFYCGDMAGRPGDLDVTDKEFAERCGLPFRTPEEVFGPAGGKAAVPKRDKDGDQTNHNEELCEIFLKISAKLKEVDKFKARAFENAATTLKDYDKKVEGKKEAMKLRGIGKSIGEKVEEYCTTGKIKLMEELFGTVEATKEKAKKEAEEKEQGMAFAFMD